MKKLLSLLAATGLIAGSLLATALPAQAEESGTEVTLTSGIIVKDLVISSKACKAIPMSMTFKADPADAVFDGVGAVLTIRSPKDSQSWLEFLLSADTGRVLTNTELIDPWSWCPTKGKDNISGLGKFRVVGEELMWWGAGVLQADENADPTGGYGLDTATTFTVKQASKASSAKVSKKGTTRTLSATFTYFDITKKAKKEWTALPKNTKVELQRRAANGKGDWKKIKTVKVGSKGAVKTTYKTKTTYQYRFVYAGNSTKAPVTSKTLKK